MTRDMVDSTNANAVIAYMREHPDSIGCGYTDHFPDRSYYTIRAAFPDTRLVLATCIDPADDAHELDCESGDARPDQCPDWVLRQRQRGLSDPWVYCSLSIFPTVRAQFVAQRVTEPFYRVAWYSGTLTLAAPIVAQQFSANVETPTGLLDFNHLLDYIPGFDPAPKPPNPPPPPKEDDMAYMVNVDVDGTGKNGQTWIWNGGVYSQMVDVESIKTLQVAGMNIPGPPGSNFISKAQHLAWLATQQPAD